MSAASASGAEISAPSPSDPSNVHCGGRLFLNGTLRHRHGIAQQRSREDRLCA